jgi:uncharacterized membrane protein YjgN (DUF898 family)
VTGPPPIPTGLATEFVGTRGQLFKLALVTGIWTVLTLGFYRFWMKTRLRRWYWSSIRPGGLPLEYVGDPLEKLLGFFIAVVIMAFYIGIVNLILMFVSLSLFASNFTAYGASFIGVVPIYFFASYRARRYVLGRTRWRGVRFGLEPGAWGYAGRAVWHWSITLLTLGILWPRKRYYLEKYQTDRTVFGSVTLHQGGTWQMLMPCFVHVLIAGFVIGVATIEVTTGNTRVAMLYGIAVPWFIGGLVHYNVQATRLLAIHKSAGELGLTARPRTGTIARIYGFGYIATGLLALLPLSLIVIVVGLVETARLRAQWDADALTSDVLGVPIWAWTILGAFAYFAVFLMWSVLRHCFVTMPVWRHYAATLTIENPDALEAISQKDRDEFREAEGFAEALDLGAAI